jgi:SAM-dependent methyltransferase
MNSSYVHGYSARERRRLEDQASTLSELMHSDSVFPPGEHVLEVGCGVGAQTVILARKNPDVLLTSIDISQASIEQARRDLPEKDFPHVRFERADLFDLPFPDGAFDHVFACFVLEHLSNPEEALRHMARVLKAGGTLVVIEGDHGSAYFHPHSDEARMAIECQITLQAEAGGNALIGRELYPLLVRAGYRDVTVSPRMVYVDAGKPELVDGFTRKTFTAMIEGVKDAALKRKLLDRATFEKGIRDLYRTTEPDGTFCYTFFKATAFK